MFAYNTIVSSSTGVTPHYAMFGHEATLHICGLGFPHSAEKRTMYHCKKDMLEERQCAYKSIREVQGGRGRQIAQNYKPLTQNIRARSLVWYFDPRIIPGKSHKLISFWAGPYQVTKVTTQALAEIKPVYYPGEERLLSLDVLKL